MHFHPRRFFSNAKEHAMRALLTGMGLRIAAASIGLIGMDLARVERKTPEPPPTPKKPKPRQTQAAPRFRTIRRGPLDKGEGAAARRLRQIQRGQLHAANGLVSA